MQLKSYPITVLLVDDQPLVAEAIRLMLQEEKNIAFYYCENPSKAIEMANQVHPTVILQDLVMPDVDGLTLLRYYQVNSETADVPVIMLSATEDPLVKADAFALGATDYIVKLPDKVELLARIHHHSQAYVRLLERNDAYKKIVESQDLLNADLVNASNYVISQLPKELEGEVKASWRFLPSVQLGGDFFGYYWLDADHFVLYVLDVCGHGVGAALLSSTVSNAIRSQSLVGVDFKNPSQVLNNLNELFPMEKYHDMFFTIWYGVYNKKTRDLVYSSGGHPPAFLFDLTKPCSPQREVTENLPVGADSRSRYFNVTCKIPPKNRFFLFSDGAYEIRNAQNEMITIEDFAKILDNYVKKSYQDLDVLVESMRNIQRGNDSFADDISLIEFEFR